MGIGVGTALGVIALYIVWIWHRLDEMEATIQRENRENPAAAPEAEEEDP